MRFGSAIKTMTLDAALKTFALGGAGYINHFTFIKDIGQELLSKIVAGQIIVTDTELTQVSSVAAYWLS